MRHEGPGSCTGPAAAGAAPPGGCRLVYQAPASDNLRTCLCCPQHPAEASGRTSPASIISCTVQARSSSASWAFSAFAAHLQAVQQQTRDVKVGSIHSSPSGCMAASQQPAQQCAAQVSEPLRPSLTCTSQQRQQLRHYCLHTHSPSASSYGHSRPHRVVLASQPLPCLPAAGHLQSRMHLTDS